MESQLVDDQLEIRRFLLEGIKSSAPATLWTAGQKLVISARLARIDEAGGMIVAKATPGSDPVGLSVGEDCYFSIPLLSASILFKAELRRSSPDGLRFEIPKVLYKFQRRGEMRFALPAKDRPEVKVGGQPYSLLDVSPGGLCFLATHEAATTFCQGIHFDRLEFSLEGRAIVAQGEVRHAEFYVLTEEKLTGTRVGLQFKGLSDEDERRITAFVFEGTRKLLLSNF